MFIVFGQGVATEGHPYNNAREYLTPRELFVGAALRGRPTVNHLSC